VMVLVIVEIGIVGPILATMLEVVLGIRVPNWLGEFADQITYAGLISVIYFAVIGATWTVCRKTFGQLLDTGDAEILKAIKAMSESPTQREKRERKLAAKKASGAMEGHAPEKSKAAPGKDQA